MIALVLALATHGGPAPVVAAGDVVRVKARPEIPWIAAALALPVPPVMEKATENADRLAARIVDARAPANAALVAAGGSIEAIVKPGGIVVVVEGPPEIEKLIVDAAMAARRTPPGPLPPAKIRERSSSEIFGDALFGPRRARNAVPVLFVEGRVTLASRGALAPLEVPTITPRPYKAEAGTIIGHPLVPSQSLLGVEGAALEVVLADVLSPIGARDITVHVEGDRAFWSAVVENPESINAARTALGTWLTTPLTPRALEVLAARAHGLRARRFAEVGAWAQHSATGVLAFGGIVDEASTSLSSISATDLGVAMRARIFPEAIRAVARPARPAHLARPAPSAHVAQPAQPAHLAHLARPARLPASPSPVARAP